MLPEAGHPILDIRHRQASELDREDDLLQTAIGSSDVGSVAKPEKGSSRSIPLG